MFISVMLNTSDLGHGIHYDLLFLHSPNNLRTGVGIAARNASSTSEKLGLAQSDPVDSFLISRLKDGG